MEGLDVLGAVEFEEYLVGATVPDEKPTVRKLSRVSSKANTAASKLARLKSPKAKRAAQKLRAHASAAVTKGQKLTKAVARARSKAAAALAKPAAKPFVAQAASRAAQYAARPAPAVVVVPTRVMPMRPSRAAAALRTSASAPTRSMQTPRAAVVAPTKASPVRRGASMVPSKGVSVLGLSQFQLQAAANWVGPMLDVYNAFANALDDASVAAEVWAQVEPLWDQLNAKNPSHPLLEDGNAILNRANNIIASLEVPADPPAGEESVGWWVGETTAEGSSLQADAIAWIKQARLALGQWGTPAATSTPELPPAPPTEPEMPPMNQTTPASSGGGGGGGAGGGEEEGAPADEGGAPAEGEGGEEEGAYAEEGEGGEEEGAYAEEGEGYPEEYAEEEYASDEYAEDEYAPEEGEEYAEDEGEYAEEGEGEEGEEGEEVSALEALSLIGRGGRGGGGRGGRGGHRHGGHRGMRGPWYYGGGPYYVYPEYYGYDVLLEDDEELADKIAKKVAEQQWAAGTHVGAYDIQSAQRQMNTLKDVTVAIARVMVKHGERVALETIALASGGTFDRSLPGITSLKKTLGHVQWHENNLIQYSDPAQIYPNSADLKKWVMQSFVDANAVEEGRATQEAVWNAMWAEIGAELAKMPKKIVQTIVKLPGQALEAVTGVPSWVWWVGGSVLLVGVGVGAWKLLTLATPAVASTVAKRYLP